MPKSESDGVIAAIGMIFLILGLSVLIPSVIVNLENPQSTTFTQFEAERTVITGDVNSQVTQITNQDEVNITVLDKKTGEIASTGLMNEGDTVTLQFEGQDFNVTLLEVYGNYAAITTYEYPLYLGWPDGASLIVSEAPLLIILATVVMLLGLLFTIQGVFWQ
jgi:hypothetical protein